MHNDKAIRAAGVIEAVFAHRFVLRRQDGTRVLADLGPGSADAFALVEGATVSIEGEAKPSEMKVATIMPKGGEPVAIKHGKRRDEHAEIGPAAASAEIERAGLVPLGKPVRKPKHFEVLARRGDDLVEVHVELGGGIRKEKPADPEKWADAIAAVA